LPSTVLTTYEQEEPRILAAFTADELDNWQEPMLLQARQIRKLLKFLHPRGYYIILKGNDTT
jgi:hypothetical protein